MFIYMYFENSNFAPLGQIFCLYNYATVYLGQLDTYFNKNISSLFANFSKLIFSSQEFHDSSCYLVVSVL